MSYIVPNSSRNEIKFVGDHSSLDSIFCWLQLNQYGFYKEFPDRKVNSIYFDSYDYDAYKDSLAGIATRKKIRYRWHGTSLFPIQGALELKYKRNYLCRKLVYKMGDIDIHKGTFWGSIR